MSDSISACEAGTLSRKSRSEANGRASIIASIVEEVSYHEGRTIYSRFGWLFDWVCVVLCIGMMLHNPWSKPKKKSKRKKKKKKG